VDAVLPIVVSLTVIYGMVCGQLGAEPGAPLWLSWPLPIWNRIAHDWRQPRQRPDYAKIARLERELGIEQPDKGSAS